MATEFETEQHENVGSLVGGIVHDAKKLLVEQLTLFQVEIKNDLKRTLLALAPLISGIIVAFTGVLLLAFCAADLINWMWQLPGWAGYGIVGVVIMGAGVGLVFWAKSILNSVSPILPDTALKGLRENLQWKTKN